MSICPACLLEPEVLGGLELEEEIGRGGMGAVYKARHLKLGRTVAVKLLPEELANQPEFQQRFEREARALAMLNHPNIIAVHDFGQDAGKSYIVMEFVAGGSLTSRMPMPAKEAVEIGLQVCDALGYAHRHGVVHRDIKPENILLDSAGRVKVTDFGIARLVGVEARGWTVTTANVILGTPHYMAPEAAEGAPPDPRMDIYSVGVLLYQMITGRLPVGNFEPLPGLLDRIVRKALSPDPAKRYATAEELRRDLESAKLLPLVEDLEPHEQQWMSAVALLQAISTVLALWAVLASITPKEMDGKDLPPLILIGKKDLPNGRIYSRARFEMWWTIAALVAFVPAITAYGFLRHHWKMAGLERPQPDRPIREAKWVFAIGLVTLALYVARRIVERQGHAWMAEYAPVLGGLILTGLLFCLWRTTLQAWRTSRPLRREPLMWVGFAAALVPPMHNLILELRHWPVG
jgi:serine/threonine-protein kinase